MNADKTIRKMEKAFLVFGFSSASIRVYLRLDAFVES